MIDNKNISNSLNEEQMMAYVNNTMSQEERYAFEKSMNDNAFLSDATEGIGYLQKQDAKKLDEYVLQLNAHLQGITQSSKNKRKKRKLELQDWIIMAVVLIISLCTLAYYVLFRKGIY